MQISIRPNQSCAESIRNYQSLLLEIITFLDYFNDKVLRLYSEVKLDPLLYLRRLFAGLTPGDASRFATFHEVIDIDFSDTLPNAYSQLPSVLTISILIFILSISAAFTKLFTRNGF